MSSTIIDNQFYSDRNLDVYEKTVLSYLIRYYNKKLGYSYPTRKQIQEDNGISTGKLTQVLNSLESKGYIKRANNPKKGGRNNIYYIYKYIVTDKSDDITLSEPQRELIDDNSTNNSNDNIKSDTEPIRKTELSVNEKLLRDVGIQKLNSEQLNKLNKLDTDKLIKTIEIAKQNSNNINFNYLLAIYNNKNTYEEPHRNNKGQAVKGAKQQVFTGNTVKTKYHDTFNEHYKKYSPDDLEAKLLKVQNKMSFASNL